MGGVEMKYKVTAIDFKVYDFVACDGRMVHSEGMIFHLSALETNIQRTGDLSVFLNARKMTESYIPVEGDIVRVIYDCYGKPRCLVKARE